MRSGGPHINLGKAIQREKGKNTKKKKGEQREPCRQDMTFFSRRGSDAARKATPTLYGASSQSSSDQRGARRGLKEKKKAVCREVGRRWIVLIGRRPLILEARTAKTFLDANG